MNGRYRFSRKIKRETFIIYYDFNFIWIFELIIRTNVKDRAPVIIRANELFIYTNCDKIFKNIFQSWEL